MNRDFVCVAVNTDGDPSAGSSHAHAPSDQAGRCSPGIGNQNVQTIFLTPDQNIFHTASGFQDAAQLKKEMSFAKELFHKIQQTPRLAEKIVRSHHHDRMLQSGYSRQTLQNAGKPPSSLGSQQASVAGFPGLSQPTGNSPFNIFAKKTERARLLDYQFSQNYPMLSWEQFERNPRLLVGNAVTSFASGNASGGHIGGNGSGNTTVFQGDGG